uniref:Uncharacterized protein n=3 Tax=Lepeophtheirus salmonis TaxID=72036 RepID=A0A0K2UXU9_LEPSM
MKKFHLPETLMPDISGSSLAIELELIVEKGYVSDVKITLPRGMLDPDYDLANILYGQPFTRELPFVVHKSLNEVPEEKRSFLIQCVEESIRDVV